MKTIDITIADRITTYVIYSGAVSVSYYKELLRDKDFIITINMSK